MNRGSLGFDADDFADALGNAIGLERPRRHIGEAITPCDRSIAAFAGRVRRLLEDLPPDLTVDDLRGLADGDRGEAEEL